MGENSGPCPAVIRRLGRTAEPPPSTPKMPSVHEFPVSDVTRKTALVTGGAQRIGRAIVQALAAAGWTVAIHHGRSRAEAEMLANDLRATGADAVTIAG